MHPNFCLQLNLPSPNEPQNDAQRERLIKELYAALNHHSVANGAMVELSHDTGSGSDSKVCVTLGTDQNGLLLGYYDDKLTIRSVHPENLLRHHLAKAITAYNTQVEGLIRERIQELDDLEFKYRYEVRVLQAEWREHHIVLEATDDDDLLRQIESLGEADDALESEDQCSTESHDEFVGRYEGLKLPEALEDCILTKERVGE